MPKQTTKWLYGMPFWHGITYRVTIFTLNVIGLFIWRFKVSGKKTLPKKEPFLLLGNHSCMYDPFWVGAHVPRGVKSMASAAVLSVPYVGQFLKMCGCFPKMKYTKDKASMQLVQQNYDDGYPILIFPEGNRSWDGRMGPVSKGIGRLIKRMDCPVVYCTFPTASLYQPRWAMYPRWVPVVVNFTEAHRYDDTHTVEDIWQDVCTKISVEPLIPEGSWTFGFRMAHGLPQYLWACPSCYTLDTLKVSKSNGNKIECTHCSEAWTLTVRNEMIGTATWTVREAFDRISLHFGERPVVNQQIFDAEGISLHCEKSTILRRSDSTKKMTTRIKGTLTLTEKGLEVNNENEQWQVPHEEITAISVEIANLLQFRIDGVVHRMVTPSQSSLMWAFFLRGWQS